MSFYSGQISKCCFKMLYMETYPAINVFVYLQVCLILQASLYLSGVSLSRIQKGSQIQNICAAFWNATLHSD